MKRFCLCLATVLTISPAFAHDPIEFHSSEAYRKAGFPFSPAVEADGWIFLSGAIGTVPGTTTLIEGGIEAETKQIMTNIQSSLANLDVGMDRIVKCTAMLADMAEWPAFNRVYKTFFETHYPARSAFGTSGLALNARIEIECIAKR